MTHVRVNFSRDYETLIINVSPVKPVSLIFTDLDFSAHIVAIELHHKIDAYRFTILIIEAFLREELLFRIKLRLVHDVMLITKQAI